MKEISPLQAARREVPGREEGATLHFGLAVSQPLVRLRYTKIG